jgi:hypothetical protein
MAEYAYMKDAAEYLNRRPATIRAWERSGILPKNLRPSRTDRGWRYWTYDQLDDIRHWMLELDLRPGKGLKHYNPTPEDIARHLEGQRKPRKHAALASSSE